MGSASEGTMDGVAAASEVGALGDPRPLTHADLDRACPAITRAFAWHEPWGEWSLPHAPTREATLLELVTADVRDRFIPQGECWTIGGVCASLWIPPPPRPGSAAFTERRGEDEYRRYGARAEALRVGDRLLASLRPETEHWYLDTLATDPAWMGRGLAGRLLDHDLAIRDEHGDACGLDTHTEVNVAFYQRRGFEVIGEGRLPEGGPELYVMLRPPATEPLLSPPTAVGAGATRVAALSKTTRDRRKCDGTA